MNPKRMDNVFVRLARTRANLYVIRKSRESEHAGFHEKMLDPEDYNARLVYADYLQEQGLEPAAARLRWWTGLRRSLPPHGGRNTVSSGHGVARQVGWVRRLVAAEHVRREADEAKKYDINPAHHQLYREAARDAELQAIGVLGDHDAVLRAEERAGRLLGTSRPPTPDSVNSLLAGNHPHEAIREANHLVPSTIHGEVSSFVPGYEDDLVAAQTRKNTLMSDVEDRIFDRRPPE